MGGEVPENAKGKIMHSQLKGGVISFMGSDSTAHDHFDVSAISLALGGTDEAKLTEIFNKLAEEGKVTQPLEKAPWGDMFGGLTDKYGIDWMVNINANAAA
jgi:PhnB protein